MTPNIGIVGQSGNRLSPLWAEKLDLHLRGIKHITPEDDPVYGKRVKRC